MIDATLLDRCPNCGEGKLFESTFQLKEICSHCQVRYERGRGEWTGPVVIGYTFGAGISFFLWVYLFATDRLFIGVEWVLAFLTIATGLITYRYAKGWWIWLIHAGGWVYPDLPKSSRERP